MGLTVSVVAAIFTYRNNFGWSPLALITSIGMTAKADGAKKYTALVDVEIWNRRKYPILVRHMVVGFDGLELSRDNARQPVDGWHRHLNSMTRHSEYAISPQMHEKHHVAAPFSANSLDAIDAALLVEVWIFDPRLNRTVTLRTKGRYCLNEAYHRPPRPKWRLPFLTTKK